jgi:ZU5 domain
MSLRTLSRFGARLVSVLLLAGCARDATAPVEPVATPDTANAALLGLLPVRGVTRAMPLANDIAVSAVIGSTGGTLTIPEAGLTLVVPAGAVSSDIRFTATALAGKLVAYDFQPHGTKFAVPLQFTQDLRKTNLLATLTSPLIDGAYFADRSRLNQASGTAFVSELRAATVSLLQFRASFPIDHFSGYLISWH